MIESLLEDLTKMLIKFVYGTFIEVTKPYMPNIFDNRSLVEYL